MGTWGVIPARHLVAVPHGARERVGGVVRKRPETARRMAFMTLEDETDTLNVVVRTALHFVGGLTGSFCVLVAAGDNLKHATIKAIGTALAGCSAPRLLEGGYDSFRAKENLQSKGDVGAISPPLNPPP
jgi:hypothetical protein